MMIEEIVRSCVHESVALAAVKSISPAFYRDVDDAALACGMAPGAFAAFAVRRFARCADEAEARSVLAAMATAQQPVLAGLHQILRLTLADQEAKTVRAADVTFPFRVLNLGWPVMTPCAGHAF